MTEPYWPWSALWALGDEPRVKIQPTDPHEIENDAEPPADGGLDDGEGEGSQ